MAAKAIRILPRFGSSLTTSSRTVLPASSASAAGRPRLPEPLLRDLLATTRTIADNLSQAHALTGLLPYLSGEERVRVVPATLALAGSAVTAYAGRSVLVGLVPWLSADQSRDIAAALDPEESIDFVKCRELRVGPDVASRGPTSGRSDVRDL